MVGKIDLLVQNVLYMKRDVFRLSKVEIDTKNDLKERAYFGFVVSVIIHDSLSAHSSLNSIENYKDCVIQNTCNKLGVGDSRLTIRTMKIRALFTVVFQKICL